jgi:hypothetical protein
LKVLLESNNMRAVTLFQSLRAALEPACGTAHITTLASAINHLDFTTAATLLEALISGKDAA